MKFKLLLSFLLISVFGFSQTLDVNGIIKDSKSGMPIAGINIKVKGTTFSTSTDFDGSFQFSKISKGSVLQFSFIGYRSFDVTVNSSEKLNLKMTEDKNSLDEIVVLGYSSKKKKDVTGAVAVLSSKTIEQLKPIKVEQALQGTIAGVNVTAQSGAPGAGLNIKIRGIGTNGNADAFVLIDGVPGDLSILSPDDIESISVLKDAQAAIYGTLGANGIVIVTTKQGKKNSKTKVTINSYTGLQETTRKLDLLNSREYKLLLNESYANGGQPIPFPIVSNTGTDTNWQNEVFNTAPIVNHDFNVTGGSDKITYSLSGSDLNQQGIIGKDKSEFKRNTARLGLGIDVTSKLKLETSAIYTFIKRNSINENGLGSVLFNAINTPSIIAPFDDNNNYTLVPSTNGYGIEVINPLAQIENTYNDYDLKKINGFVKLNYNVFKNFNLITRVGFNSSNSKGKSFSKIVDYNGKVFDIDRSAVNQNAINDNDYTIDFFGEYENTFFQSHKVKATIGTTVYKQFGSGLFATGFDVPDNKWDNADIALALGTSPSGGRDVGSYAYDERRLSHFAILDYSFKGRYLLSGSLRRDLSTKFGPDKRVAYFPSILGGWIVSEENFFNKNSFFNFLKFRGSYGFLGNDQIPNNGYVGILGGEATYIFNDQITNGTAVGVIPNPVIQWEAAEKFDVGLDLKLFKSKIDITADYFIDTRNELLIGAIPVSGITGISAPGSGAPTANGGTVENKGYEFTINYKDKLSENFNFSIGYNFTKIQNIVTEVNNPNKFIDGGSFGLETVAPARMEEGFPMGYFWGFATDGIFQNQDQINNSPSQTGISGIAAAPGDLKFKDTNGDNIIDVRDRTDVGNPLPEYTMGLNINLNYKNLDFIVYTYASIGNEMVRNYERTLSDLNKLNYTLDRWTGEGTSNTVPRVTTGASNNTIFSDFYVEDASFVRIQNVQLGYTLNKKFSDKIGISKFRLYTSVNNLYTFTRYKGFDPAASNGAGIGSGIDYGFYPTPKTYIVGINLSF